MQFHKFFLPFLLFAAIFACKPVQKSTETTNAPQQPTVPVKPAGDDGIIDIVFLQMNDVYEITPTISDNMGGMARVATIRQNLLKENPNTVTILAGDFISPSVTGTLRHEGKRIRGKQMIETMNALGVDLVVFGNHEFDYDDPADLQARLDESNFTWLAGNARLKTQTWTMQFYKNRNGGQEICPDHKTMTFKDADGTTLELGVFGVLIDSGKKPYVEYSDWATAAQKSYAALAPKTDVCVAVTHLAIENDLKLAAMFPKIPLVMGGHEHENTRQPVGNTVVCKADANARTVYIHRMRYNKKTQTTTLKSELKQIDASIPDETNTATVIGKWEKIKNDALTSAGFNPTRIIKKLEKGLDCRETTIRQRPAEVGTTIADAMLAAAKNKPDCAILNSGSIRVDDVLSGSLSELDVVRMLPFGGGISEADMKGSLLRQTLEAGHNNKGNGGYLQMQNIRRDAATGNWFVRDMPLKDDATYRVVLPDFLLTGSEQNMGFLKTALNADGKTTNNPGITALYKPVAADKTDVRNDVRHALIAYWTK
jgi:2',3'-cyclic-nucleotide 2'-phosphodiesterase (5'-nucleotidase family)